MLDQAEKLRQMASDDVNQKPKVITVTSGKGGVGKSNLVVNLAIALQKKGKKVLIFDADIGMGNDDVLLGFMPRFNVFDIVFKDKQLDEVILNGPFGVKLLPGGSGLAKADSLTEEQQEVFLRKLSSIDNIDYILMDTGAGINRNVLGFISSCDDLILITTPEPTSLTDSYSLLKAVSYFKLKNKARLVINRSLDYQDARLTFEKFNNAVTNFLNIEVEYLGFIVEEKKLSQAVREQKPFLLTYPSCEATKCINNIADKLLEVTHDKPVLGVEGLFRKIFSLFS